MSIVRVKGIERFRDRHGKWRCYHRKTGPPISRLILEPVSSLLNWLGWKASPCMSETPARAPSGWSTVEYRGSAAFSGLAPRTRADYQRVFDYLKPIADTPLPKFDRTLIVRIRDKASTRGRRFANYVKAVLSIVFGWGAERGYADGNPAKNVKNIRRPKGTPHANRPWTDAERHTVLDSAPSIEARHRPDDVYWARPCGRPLSSTVVLQRRRHRHHAVKDRGAGFLACAHAPQGNPGSCAGP